ncbi:indolepyruvate ferredoxin oxidoreductase family protein [soil metagenome]
MNAPLPEQIRLALETVSLDDKYGLNRGSAFMSGVQALVRLPMLQKVRDAAAGLNTAGFISGYRGSPLGGYDQALWSAKKHLAEHDIVFQPGVNEELGATAVWGSQQLDLYPESKKFDGVFGLWYGKGPGADRCADVFKHANMAGTSKLGGVIALVGDDHVSKSSTAAHQTDHLFKACGLPVFFPNCVQDILDMGLHALALSRFAGVWSGMKTIQEIVESSSSVSIDPDRVSIVLPTDFPMPPGGVHIRWPDTPLDQEQRLMDHKWYAALAYIRANKLNHTVIDSPNARFGLIASGKAYNDTRQALDDLGLDDAQCRQLGIRVHKVNVVWPLEATGTRTFAEGLQEILVVEEKRQMIEYQLKEELYNWRPDVRPNVLGKFDEQFGDNTGGEWSMPNPSQNWLLRANADLSPAIIARAIGRRLRKLGVPAEVEARIEARIALIDAKERSLAAPLVVQGDVIAGVDDADVDSDLASSTAASTERPPWFCSGCPHNTSTRVPEGSRAMAGIGCHYIALWMDRSTTTFSQMGGEGAAWIGQAPFTTDKHVFVNLGDGTYFHSGLLAIRQAISSKVNITYKILYNDAVAMTGGQPVEGSMQVPEMTRELDAEGVKRIVVVSDEPEKYDTIKARLAHGVTVHHRDDLDSIQRDLRETIGCTVLIYDQTCATEKRRRRKRGTLAEPDRTVVINELVCEGCGDCSDQSNCLSVEPFETEFGRKRRINQNTCNKDYSCLNGFCPSFVTVTGGKARSKSSDPVSGAPAARPRPSLTDWPAPPEPTLPSCEGPFGIVVAGVGGTGVITIGQVLGMAAHLEHKGIVTQDAAGLAQKGGATWSHVQIAERAESIRSTKVGTADADLVIAADAIVAANKVTLGVIGAGRSFVVLNSHATPTAAFVHDPDWRFPSAACDALIESAAGRNMVGRFDSSQASSQLLGDAIYANPMMLGYAWQLGRIPLRLESIMRSIELNGVQAVANKAAFEWGRRAAHDPAAFQKLVDQTLPSAGQPGGAQVIKFVPRGGNIEELASRRVAFLTSYQNQAYAQGYKAIVDKVRGAEAKLGQTRPRLSEAVARYLFKLMAYKDEYEVARLHTDTAFADAIKQQFEGNVRLDFYLAPPIMGKTNDLGEPVKQRFGPWMATAFKVLARFKFLRGTALDPFGRTEERRAERALIAQYLDDIEMVLSTLTVDRLAAAVELLSLPESIRGYGHVKARHMAAAAVRRAQLLDRWRAPPSARAA